MKFNRTLAAFGLAALLAACTAQTAQTPSAGYDVVIRGGTLYDGSGGAPSVGDVASAGDRIA